jgi:ketosteroid isomerase-like protein
MADEPATPDPVELVRRSFEPINGRDVEATMNFYSPDSIWDMSLIGLGTYEGLVEIRDFFEDWVAAYDDFEIEPQDILDFGNGIVLAFIRQTARPVGSSADVELRYASVSTWKDGVNVRTTNYADLGEARVAAQRLAEQRGS